MKQGSKNMLLIGGAGIALYILMKGGDLPGGPSDIFGGKEEKGTVASAWTGSGGESGGAAIPESFTKKEEATGYTPTGYTLQDMIYQRDVEPGIVATKKNALTQSSYAVPLGFGESLYSQQAKIDPVLANILAAQSPTYGIQTSTSTSSTKKEAAAPTSLYSQQAKVDPVLANILAAQSPSYSSSKKSSSSAVTTPNAPKAGSLASGAGATSYKTSISVKSGAPTIKTSFSSVRAW